MKGPIKGSSLLAGTFAAFVAAAPTSSEAKIHGDVDTMLYQDGVIISPAAEQQIKAKVTKGIELAAKKRPRPRPFVQESGPSFVRHIRPR